jgi:hypothetical protein
MREAAESAHETLPAAVGLRDGPDDGESEAGTAVGRGRCRVGQPFGVVESSEG